MRSGGARFGLRHSAFGPLSPVWPEEEGVFAPRIFVGIERSFNRSPIFSTLLSLRCPSFQDALYIAPVSLIVSDGFFESSFNPVYRITPFGILQFLGQDGRQQTDILLIKGENVGPLNIIMNSSDCRMANCGLRRPQYRECRLTSGVSTRQSAPLPRASTQALFSRVFSRYQYSTARFLQLFAAAVP